MYGLLVLALTANACTVNLTGQDGSPVQYDLSVMERDENYVRDYIFQGDDNYDYFANICGETTMNCGWDGTAVAIQKTKGSVCVSTLAKSMGDDMQGQWLNANDPSLGVRVTFNDGDECDGMPRTTVFNLYCSKGKTVLTKAGEDGPGFCSYTFNFNTPAVCPSGGGSNTRGGSGGSSGGSSRSPSASAYNQNKGWSYGTYFLIGLLLLSILYCVGGIYYNRKQEESLSYGEAVPHLEFWQELPGLAVDGCRFTVTKVKSMISSSNENEI